MPPKRKKRFHGLYYHSSPPRVLPMNGQASSEIKKKSADDFSVRLSTIRIWMHEKDIGKLTRVLWAGQGNRLRQQASTNPRVKRFLAAVPYVMNTIKDVHQSVVDNSLETLQATMEPPVPPALITCKDANGLNVIHKAAGLGHTMILEYLLSIWPDGAHETDMTGKTPLHWAASAKNNMRCYTLLTQAGCEEDALDYKMKTPAYYKQKHNEIERSFLTLVPDCPRVSHDIPTDWEALAYDDSDDKKKSEIKIPNGRRQSDVLGNGMNLLTSRSEANSIENTSEPDLSEGANGTEEHSEPPPEESEATESDDRPLENGHVTKGDGDISEPPTPPKTAEEKPKDNDEEEEEVKATDEPSELSEDENVSNDLNDQNNHEANGLNEDEDKTNDDDDDDVENGEERDVDEVGSKGEDNEEDEKKEKEIENNTENEVESSEKDADEVKEAEEEEEEEKEENEEEEGKESDVQEEEEIDDDVQVDSNEKEEESNDEVHSDKENEPVDESEEKEETNETETEAENDVKDTEEDEEDDENKEEANELAESDTKSEKDEENNEVPEDDTQDEKENEHELSQQPESDSGDCESEAQKSEKSQNERSLEKPQSPDDPVKDESENITEKDDSQNAESKESSKENDDDDDDQDTQLEQIDTETSQEPPKDENENITEFDDKMTTDSPTSSLAIEGFVLGDSEDNQVQSESAAYLDDEEKYIKAIIDSGDMEQLAALVLNGDGKKILNRKSSQPEIQAFLNNVPAYMNKISRVHEAARQGTLYQLQSALDRRKFAIAKDAMSPCGASPLHVAVLFGHSDIVRYLAGRFPETTSAVDDDGRTPLHYAATIKDNGHFFNLLSHLGGNPKAVDKLGNTAGFYADTKQAKDVLTYKQLLRRFGAETLEDEMLSDQGLGDPLIKGLTEIAEKRPSDPVAYLAGFLQNYLRSRKNNRDNDTGDTNSTAVVNSEPEVIDSPEKIRNGIDSGLVDERYSSPEMTPKTEDRDEHGQSMLHFACARTHRKNGLINLIEEAQIDVTYRDELYRTARDVSLQANQPGNAKEIDRYVLSLAVVGDTKPFENMAINGYDHILDVVDDEGTPITQVAESRGHDKLVEFLNDLRGLEESREELHQAVRDGDFEKVKEITSSSKGKWLIKAKNYYGRTAMHIAVLKELEEMVEYFVNTCPDALKCGDNLERTPLHYAMGTNAVEGVSRVLIRKGAKRTTKDLKGRQPSYYFINKADILRLQEEEDENR